MPRSTGSPRRPCRAPSRRGNLPPPSQVDPRIPHALLVAAFQFALVLWDAGPDGAGFVVDEAESCRMRPATTRSRSSLARSRARPWRPPPTDGGCGRRAGEPAFPAAARRQPRLAALLPECTVAAGLRTNSKTTSQICLFWIVNLRNLASLSAPGEGRRRRRVRAHQSPYRWLAGLRLRLHQHDAQHNPKSGRGAAVSCLLALP